MIPDKKTAIQRMCLLQHHVAKDVHGHRWPTDCFCGRREELDGYGSSFANAGMALDYIEETVKARIRRHWVKQSILNLIDRGLQRLRKKLGAEVWDDF